MYLPQHFQEVSAEEINGIVEAAPLACIVAHTTAGLIANHVPVLSGADGVLIGHLARANDMHISVREQQEVLAIFRGGDAYVSPNFYPTKREHHRHVPTWNYPVVHVYGNITFQHDDRSKHAAVALLTRSHERRLNGDEAWRMSQAPKDYLEEMLKEIVAFRITVNKILAKSKLSQNHEPRNYLGVVEGLRASGNADMAEKMARLRSREPVILSEDPVETLRAERDR